MAKRQSENPEPSFEEALAELQSIVSELEEGSAGLEASLQRFERGIGLLRTCYSILESAEAKVEVLTKFNGQAPPTTVPFENAATFTAAQELAPSGDTKEDAGQASLF